MTHVKKLLVAYPTVAIAVAWVELMICERDVDGTESSWDMMMRSEPPMNPATVVECLKEAIADETIGKSAQARAEMERPEFLAYIAGKMGAV